MSQPVETGAVADSAKSPAIQWALGVRGSLEEQGLLDIEGWFCTDMLYAC